MQLKLDWVWDRPQPQCQLSWRLLCCCVRIDQDIRGGRFSPSRSCDVACIHAGSPAPSLDNEGQMKDKDVNDQREGVKVPAQMQPMQVLRFEHSWDGYWISHYPTPRFKCTTILDFVPELASNRVLQQIPVCTALAAIDSSWLLGFGTPYCKCVGGYLDQPNGTQRRCLVSHLRFLKPQLASRLPCRHGGVAYLPTYQLTRLPFRTLPYAILIF